MITTEVQRTLVKSPPELWTELSDPASLARHLEGLGEIEITAVQPETRIEWRTPRASGVVDLKACGWGTKVTLTVTQEIEGAAEPAPVPAEPARAAAEQEPTTAGPEADPPDAPGVGVPEPPTPFAEEAPPPPLTAAARFAPHHPPPLLRDATADADHGEEIEPSDEPEPVRDRGAALLGDRAWPEAPAPNGFAQTVRRDAGAGSDAGEESEPDLRTEPRRGFFARLFGRRRRPAAEYVRTDRYAPAAPVEEIETLAYETPKQVAEPHYESELALDELPQQADLDAGEAPALAPAPAPPPAPAPAASEPQPSVVDAPALVDAPAPVLAPAASDPQPSDVDAPAPESALQAAASAIAEAFPVQEIARDDLAAELRAAEEDGRAEVEAVLTSMLDRLGAAHHRPFSRA
jgi:hypothetical protein